MLCLTCVQNTGPNSIFDVLQCAKRSGANFIFIMKILNLRETFELIYAKVKIELRS